MKRFLSIALIILTLFSLLTACAASDEIKYVPYVIDETEDLSAPSGSDSAAAQSPEDGKAQSTETTTTT
ncbi:MAG: hypothetical protein IJP17_08245, partial [Clostridia bacterium]|nr:hypothetical protein [Clostridia bacterium]